ncbi:MAG TPA: Rrf2 family transcriptional regulator [Chitinispirillaceae bacterium]|jgi:Rrf2 family protein|nr:Rrf2 family transcriptional regulator [Chitinispirillaceae bacterium]
MSSLLGVSQKCQYALRALFELALRYPSENVTTVAEIAEKQQIPLRFLEQILSKLRAGGYIESRRGNQGGYVMTVSPSSISVGEIIRFIEGPNESIDCLKRNGRCPFTGGCAFKDLWEKAKSSLTEIFDGTSFQDLIGKHNREGCLFDYMI